MSSRKKWPPICAHPQCTLAPEPSHSVSSPASGDDGGEEDRSSISSFPEAVVVARLSSRAPTTTPMASYVISHFALIRFDHFLARHKTIVSV